MVRLAGAYVGEYDPQMLGHLFSVGALYAYVKWRNDLTPQRLMIVATLCSLGLFTKHLLMPVPLAIAAVLVIEDRRKLQAFLLSGTLALIFMVLGTWLLVGNDFIANMSVELSRGRSVQSMLHNLMELMAGRLAIVYLAALAVSLFQRKWIFMLPAVYFIASLMVGSLAGLGRVATNAWFDFS